MTKYTLSRDKHESVRLNYGSLYGVVETLERRELIRAVETRREGRRPQRTIYEITETGKTEMVDWLAEFVAVPVKEFPQYEAALSFLRGLPPDEAVPLLRQRCQALEMRLDQMDAARGTAEKQGLPRLEAQGLTKRFGKVEAMAGLDLVAHAGQVVAVLDQLGLDDAADRLVRTYSGGMRRKLDLGASLVGAPRILLLDEPTAGLDPRSRIELWDAIRALVAQGTDVLLTTQYRDEADQLASQVVIVDHGRVIAKGTPGELKSQAGGDVIEAHAHQVDNLDRLAATLAPLGTEAPRVDPATRRVTVPVTGGRAAIDEAVRVIDAAAADIDVDDIGLRRPTLDEVFLTLTGSAIDDDRPDTDTDPNAPMAHVHAGAA